MESSNQLLRPEEARPDASEKTWLVFAALTGGQAVLTMIRAAAVFTEEAGRSCNADAVIHEVVQAYGIGAALAKQLLAGKLGHSFKDGSLLLHLSNDEISLLPTTATYSRLH